VNNTSFLFVTQMQYESTVLDTEIYLETEHINENYEAYLLEKLRDQYEGTANEQFGIINRIDGIKNLEQKRILDNSTFVIFQVTFMVHRYMPKVKDLLEIPITKITLYGIFISDHQIRILIPQAYLTDNYTIERNDATFALHCHSSKKIFHEGSVLPVEIQDIKFEKNGFSCLALIQ
jgi:DNA-directed RNA polymerase subunit E'/Rpb7